MIKYVCSPDYKILNLLLHDSLHYLHDLINCKKRVNVYGMRPSLNKMFLYCHV